VGRPHLHSQCNFAESLVETAPKSLHHSCRSELRVVPLFPAAQTMPSAQCLEDRFRQVPALTTRVHVACQSYDLLQSERPAMSTLNHDFADLCEEFKVTLFARTQWITSEVGNDSRHKKRKTSHLPLQCLIASVGSYRTTAEVLHDLVKDLRSITVLANRDAWSHLPPNEQGCSGRNRDREASFTIDVSRDV
jgi:hypothetical protein